MVRRLDRQHESLEQMVTLLATSNAGIKAEKEQTTQMLKLLEGMHGDMKKMKKKQAKTNDYLQRLEQRLSKEKPLEKKEESETEE